VRVVADTHALVWYLLDDPDRRLSSAALAALEDTELTDGIAASVASVVDLWYVVRTRGASPTTSWTGSWNFFATPSPALEAEPVTLEVAAAFQQTPRDALGDRWDRFITATATATAIALGLLLVTRDRRITELGLVETIW
jgi:PIN domain nuclease of toxin-antitoxin system